MAVLSKIRQRSLLLILVIGFCLLAFIVGDIIQNGGFGVTRNIGVVNGKDIPAQDFMNRVAQMQQGQPGLSTTQAANSVWMQQVDDILYAERVEKAGLRVGKEHVYDMYAQNPQVAAQFANAMGKFDKAKFNEFLANMKSADPKAYQNFEKNMPLVEDAAKKQLYVTMIKAGFFATEIDAKAKYAAESDKSTFDYVFVPYSTINDDEVKVSDEELIAYMKKNEKKYKSEASRGIEFVKFDNKPSAQDEAVIKDDITALLSAKVEFNDKTKATDTIPGFRNATNVADFVARNSEMPYDTTYVTKANLPVEFAEQIYNLPNGEVFGPYLDNGYYKLTKMINKKANATVDASHILIGWKGATRSTATRTKEEAKALADNLLKQVNANPSAFAALAMANTEDPGSKNNGGEYKGITPGQMMKEFDQYVFNNPVGSTGIVETVFGYHVMKVNAKNEAVQLATIAKKVQPSEATSDEIFSKATKLEMDAADKDFETLAKELNMTVMPANKLMINDENIQGIGAQRAIVKWAFDKDTKVGDVKQFDLQQQGYVVARLKTINEKGVLPLEEAKLSVLPIVRNEKKAELIRKKMQGTTLEAVAQKTGSSIATATDVTLASPMIPAVGAEPKVVGKSFGLAAGKTSGLIDGQMGVFMIRAKAVTKTPSLPNYNNYITRAKAERGGVPTRLSMSLKERADIEDNRDQFN